MDNKKFTKMSRKLAMSRFIAIIAVLLMVFGPAAPAFAQQPPPGGGGNPPGDGGGGGNPGGGGGNPGDGGGGAPPGGGGSPSPGPAPSPAPSPAPTYSLSGLYPSTAINAVPSATADTKVSETTADTKVSETPPPPKSPRKEIVDIQTSSNDIDETSSLANFFNDVRQIVEDKGIKVDTTVGSNITLFEDASAV